MNRNHAQFSRTARSTRFVASTLALAFAATFPSHSLAVENEDVFFSLGVAVGRSLTEFQLTADELAVVQKGLLEVVNGGTVAEPTEDQMKKLTEIRNARMAKLSEDFLTKVTAEPGAQVRDSGLIFFDSEPGSGNSPTDSDTVKVHYHGTLANGAVFDSSIDRGQPAEFPLNRVIACWTEGVGLMKVGGKARLVCPPGIAYGDRGAPPTIPGGAVLSFEVELLEISAAAPPTE